MHYAPLKFPINAENLMDSSFPDIIGYHLLEVFKLLVKDVENIT